jgi:phosphoglycolate phosphatase
MADFGGHPGRSKEPPLRCKGVDIPLKAALFDLDGTLIDSKKDIAAAANAARLHLGMPTLPLEKVTQYIGWGIEHLNRMSLETEDPVRLAEGLEVLKSHYREHIVEQTLVFPFVRELLEALQQHPEPLLTALQRLGAKPSEAVMIGDSPVDVQAARAAGMPVGVVVHGFVAREKLNEADPDWLVDSLKDFIDILS